MKNKIISRASILFLGIFCILSTQAQYVPLPPNQVQNVQASVLDNTIHITWDETQDQDGGVVIGYKIYYGTNSVTAQNGNQYDDEVEVLGQTEYTLSGLESGTYYIAVTAFDDEEWESDNYSQEVQATISLQNEISTQNSGEGDVPKVLSAEQTTSRQIKINFSEPIVIENITDGFVIQKTDTLEVIPFIDGHIENNKVTLNFLEGMLIPGEKYQITATSFVEDLDGTPVSSGITDTTQFTAKEIHPEPKESESKNENKLENFEKEVVEETTQEENTFTTETEEETLSLPTQEKKEEQKKEPVFEPEIQIQDTTPPYDATNIEVDTSTMLQDFYVTLFWEKSIDVDNDVVDQIVYARIDNGEWDQGYSIGKDIESIELDIELNRFYDIKIVTVDENGNVSEGETLSFSTNSPLPQTGASSYALILFVSGLFGMGTFMVLRKRNRLY